MVDVIIFYFFFGFFLFDDDFYFDGSREFYSTTPKRNVPGGEQSDAAVHAEDDSPIVSAERESLTSNPLLSVSCSSTSRKPTSLRSRHFQRNEAEKNVKEIKEYELNGGIRGRY